VIPAAPAPTIATSQASNSLRVDVARSINIYDYS